MPHVIEAASSGRAKCRGCGDKIAKGELRFGERVDNAFGDGETSLWFHLRCGATRRPEPFSEVLEHTELPAEDRAEVGPVATAGLTHKRLARLAGVQRDPSGRARCRQCREPIEKGTWRIVLQIWEDTRFSPMGFVHVPCAPAYFGTAELQPRARWVSRGLAEAELDDALATLPDAVPAEPAPAEPAPAEPAPAEPAPEQDDI